MTLDGEIQGHKFREIQRHWFLKCRKNGEIQLTNDSDAMYIGWMHYIH